ncbi:GNAT family N-acetyltransferase [Photobacterium alginatilyticum]|uniref:GNAT family N-acetyltransferase n=1 Tax=Photobacterium alginatilyticum TaxID=1775171 RepID=UPI0040675C4B
MEFIISENPSSEDVDEIYQGLKRHNIPYIGDIKESHIACFTNSNDGAKLGGIIGRTWGSWLLIKYLWVDETCHKQGMGTQLLATLENHAKESGCKFSLVDTMSFQAKPFYEKNGYQCKMTLDEYPAEGQLHFMTKELT